MLNKLKKLLHSLFVNNKKQLQSLIAHSHQRQIIDQTEFQLIRHCLNTRTTPLLHVMVDRAQALTLQHDMSLEQILGIYNKNKHSRYPVLNANSEVCGILLIKDLIAQMQNKSPFSLESIMRPAHFAPDSQTVLSLLKELQQNHQHMAIVLDEYGHFQGIVTIEDLLEQIVGAIEDEHDSDHPEYIQKISKNTYRVNGLTPIEQFNQHFQTTIDIAEFDTISGIISHMCGEIPKKGDHVTLKGLDITIHQASPTTIKKITVKTASS